MENIEEYNKFISLTLNQISRYFELLGFTYQSDEFYNDSLNLEHVKINFSNRLIDRNIELNYSKNNYGGVFRDHVSIFIENTKRSYILEDILKYEKIHCNSSSFLLSNYEGDFEQQVSGFYYYLIGLLENVNIKEWITGKKWADIPFDWGGYK